MAAEQPAPGAWTGGTVLDGVHCVLAPNPSPMTLDGTNTWLLHSPGDDQALVIDPGPDDESHLRAVLAAADELGLRVAGALLTHGHLDHSAGAVRFGELAGCPVRAADPGLSQAAPLTAGEVVEAGALQLEVIDTPGHSGDSISFVLPAVGALLTGDTVLGRGTTVVAHPDGRLGPYLSSLARLRELAQLSGLTHLLPGHGPVRTDPGGVIEGYLSHRQVRLDQVRAAVAEGAQDARDVVQRVYADVDRALWPAAELSVRAQLAYLHDQAHS
jgi:glyoxylase-like metal-dependent hydrolase (beta-lactamase superfamily II)